MNRVYFYIILSYKKCYEVGTITAIPTIMIEKLGLKSWEHLLEIIELTIVWPGFESMLLDTRAAHLTVYCFPLVDMIIYVEQQMSHIISYKKVNTVE